MQTYRLSEFITLSSAKLRLPFRHTPENVKYSVLENEIAVVLFEKISLKLEFYRALSLQNPTEFTKETSNPRVLIVECGSNSLNSIFSEQKGLHSESCYTPEQLIELIETIPQNTHKQIGKCQLNTIVIDNLSAFYWENKQKPRHVAIQWYKRVVNSVHALMNRYKCNVIFTMWDKQFERGFNSRPFGEFTGNTLNDVTYTPSEFFESFSHILSCRSTGILRYSDSQWKPL